MRKAQEREGLRLPYSTLLPILGGEPPKLDQSCFLRMEFQSELSQSFPKCFQESLGFQLIGFLGKDPEKRQVRGNGANFTVLSVATQQSWKDTNDEWLFDRAPIAPNKILNERTHAKDLVNLCV